MNVLRLYRTIGGWWRWRLETSDGTVIHRSAYCCRRQRRALIYAVLANRKPYQVVIDGGIEPDFETDSPVWRRLML